MLHDGVGGEEDEKALRNQTAEVDWVMMMMMMMRMMMMKVMMG